TQEPAAPQAAQASHGRHDAAPFPRTTQSTGKSSHQVVSQQQQGHGRPHWRLLQLFHSRRRSSTGAGSSRSREAVLRELQGGWTRPHIRPTMDAHVAGAVDGAARAPRDPRDVQEGLEGLLGGQHRRRQELASPAAGPDTVLQNAAHILQQAQAGGVRGSLQDRRQVQTRGSSQGRHSAPGSVRGPLQDRRQVQTRGSSQGRPREGGAQAPRQDGHEQSGRRGHERRRRAGGL
ncbi:unnamed protein product, partial [Prorocentrum cordatum]